jgi:hypothetical protein
LNRFAGKRPALLLDSRPAEGRNVSRLQRAKIGYSRLLRNGNFMGNVFRNGNFLDLQQDARIAALSRAFSHTLGDQENRSPDNGLCVPARNSV